MISVIRKGEMSNMKKMNKKVIVILALVMAAALVLSACGKDKEGGSAVNNDPNPKVEITMEDGGKILLELDRDAAPKTVANFVKLVNDGFYDGLTFHRIIPGFMIQGGDPDGTGMGGSKDSVEGEFSANGVENNISHERGIISMARAQDPNSASSQFFITNADASRSLDGSYAAFGKVLEGMDVVDKISAVETDANDKPLTPVVIKTIKIVD
jgi:peptidyl-prolyl cis-trans isomerase B (cyclophilin B)